jgi:hypothetical protein
MGFVTTAGFSFRAARGVAVAFCSVQALAALVASAQQQYYSYFSLYRFSLPRKPIATWFCACSRAPATLVLVRNPSSAQFRPAWLYELRKGY